MTQWYTSIHFGPLSENKLRKTIRFKLLINLKLLLFVHMFWIPKLFEHYLKITPIIHANTSKHLGIYLKVKATKSTTSNKRSAIFAVVHQYHRFFVRHKLNPYMLKHVWVTKSAKFMMNLKFITISFLFKDLYLIFSFELFFLME